MATKKTTLNNPDLLKLASALGLDINNLGSKPTAKSTAKKVEKKKTIKIQEPEVLVEIRENKQGKTVADIYDLPVDLSHFSSNGKNMPLSMYWKNVQGVKPNGDKIIIGLNIMGVVRE